jgi:hypothetical protein
MKAIHHLSMYAQAQVHSGGMIAEGCRDRAMGLLDDEQELQVASPADAEYRSTTGDSRGPRATGQAASRPERRRRIAPLSPNIIVPAGIIEAVRRSRPPKPTMRETS